MQEERTRSSGLLSFAGCDYLGLSTDHRVCDAVRAGVDAFGVGAGASLATTGRTSAHEALEEALAEFLGLEAVVVLPDAFLANLAVAESLPQETRLLLDERSHPSLFCAARATGRSYETFPHCDVDAVTALVGRIPRGSPVAVLTDGVFTPSGRRPPLRAYLDALPATGTLVVDDCHGFAVLGPDGRGSVASVLRDLRVIVVATLAKALGCYGGVVAASAERVARVRARSMAYVGTTALPPCLAVAGRKALEVFREEPERLAQLWRHTRQLRIGLKSAGFAFEAEPFPVFALVTEPTGRGAAIEAALAEAGIRVPFLDYPGGPPGGCLRATVSAAHTAEDVERFLAALTRVLQTVGVRPAPHANYELKEGP